MCKITDGGWTVYQCIQGTSFAVVLKPGPFLARQVDKTGKFISLEASIVSKKNLYHTWMIIGIVSWPWCPILHSPPFLGNSHGFSHKCIYPDFEFFIFSLSCAKKQWSLVLYNFISILREGTKSSNAKLQTFIVRRSLTYVVWTLSFRKSIFSEKYFSGVRGSVEYFLQNGTHFRANSAVSWRASKVSMEAPSSET